MLAYLFVAVALLIRFVPIAMGVPALGFAPVGAALLYFGANRPQREMAIPIALFCASDVILNVFAYNLPVTWDTFISTGWYAIAFLIGTLLRDRVDVLKVVGASLSGSISFFLISNFGVWAAYNMYPKTIDGLAACYVAAIPFFRNGLMTELIYAVAFFYLPLAIRAAQKAFATSSNEAAA